MTKHHIKVICLIKVISNPITLQLIHLVTLPKPTWKTKSFSGSWFSLTCPTHSDTEWAGQGQLQSDCLVFNERISWHLLMYLTWCQHSWREDNESNEIIRHWHQITVTLGNDNRLLSSSFPNIFIWNKNDSNLLHRESQTKIYSQNSIHWSFSKGAQLKKSTFLANFPINRN